MADNDQLNSIIREVGELVGQARTLAPMIESLRKELSTFRQEAAREGGNLAARTSDTAKRIDELAHELDRRIVHIKEKLAVTSINENRITALEAKMGALEVRNRWKAEAVRGAIIVAIGAAVTWLLDLWRV